MFLVLPSEKGGRTYPERSKSVTMAAHLTIPAPHVMWRILFVGVALTLLESTVSFVAVPAHLAAPPRRCTAQRCRSGTSLGVLELRAAVSSVVSKPAAKPRGYWHDFANVEAELRKVVADSGITGQMPSTSVLRSSGLSSLADALGRFGGVYEVAAKLNLTCGKPRGYWQDYANTRKEFEDFLAIWRITAGEPNGVPTQDMIRKAGRQDLIAAMQLHGGMQRLAQELDLARFSMRRAGGGAVSGVSSGRHKRFQARLWSFIAVNGTSGYMPSNEVLNNFGCRDLAAEVDSLGGTVKIAKRFGLKPQRRPVSLQLIEESLIKFVATSGLSGVLPSKETLLASGRADLDAKLDEIGRSRICKYLVQLAEI
jgi:hypothetical protein